VTFSCNFHPNYLSQLSLVCRVDVFIEIEVYFKGVCFPLFGDYGETSFDFFELDFSEDSDVFICPSPGYGAANFLFLEGFVYLDGLVVGFHYGAQTLCLSLEVTFTQRENIENLQIVHPIILEQAAQFLYSSFK
jgi:hypothetical protein